jgi:hypothetical protein
MKEGWVMVFSTIEEYQARIADEVLKQYGIESHIVNKPDSSFPSTGEAELYTPPEKAERAREVLKEQGIVKE